MANFGMKIAGSLLVLLGLLVTGLAPVEAAPPSQSKDLVGNDVSWPQCTKTLPTGQAFAIVGVNGGLANNSNPCFLAQLNWAGSSTGATTQPKVALYVNTANPGHEGSWWPSSNTYPEKSGTVVKTPYGDCTGDVDRACSYIYGYAKAYDDANYRDVPKTNSYFWWLDVETGNSWQVNDPNAPALNRATLEGMVNYFKSIPATGVGIYSTGSQWRTIAGSVPSGSSLDGLDSWLAGAKTLLGAKSNCSLAGLTPTSQVKVTQYVSAGVDYDYSCK